MIYYIILKQFYLSETARIKCEGISECLTISTKRRRVTVYGTLRTYLPSYDGSSIVVPSSPSRQGASKLCGYKVNNNF